MTGPGPGNFPPASLAWACGRSMCGCQKPDSNCCAARTNIPSWYREKGLALDERSGVAHGFESSPSRRAGQQRTAPLCDDVLPDLGRLLRGGRRYRLDLKFALGAKQAVFKTARLRRRQADV